MKTENKFLQGYACCLAAMINNNGYANKDHKEAYIGGFGSMTETEMVNVGIDASDITLFIREGLLL